MGREGLLGGVLGVDGEGLGDDCAVDEAALFCGGEAEGVGGEAVEVAHGALGGLVQESEGVGVEEVAVAASAP